MIMKIIAGHLENSVSKTKSWGSEVFGQEREEILKMEYV